MAQEVDELSATRTTLIGRLQDWQDQASWQAFFDTYWKLIYGVARKSGLADTEAQEVVQETMISVARHMPTFTYDRSVGSFRGWLLQMTHWRIRDQLRKRAKAAARHVPPDETSMGTSKIEKIMDPTGLALASVWDAEWEKNLAEAALEKVRRQVDPLRYQLFDCYVNKEWAPERVAEMFGVSVNQVYLAKHKVIELIKLEVSRLEANVC